MSAWLRHTMRELAVEITGEPPAAGPGSARTELLHGAALLTGRGDLAQDAVHVALARTSLAQSRAPEDGTAPHDSVLDERLRLCADVLQAVREQPPAH